jgi:ATP-dependent Lon protease
MQIFDPAAFQAILDRANVDSEHRLFGSSYEDDRLRFLHRCATDDRGGERDVLTVDAAIMVRLQELAGIAPNFVDPIGVVIRAATLSFLTGSPPGVGKSFFARRLAEALGVPLVEYPMNCADDPGVLVGHSLSWRGARAGLLARTLIEKSCASPIVFVDEIDKALWKDHGDPLDIFHTLFEPENARSFVDAYIAEAFIRADKVFWIATANDISGLKPSLLDRFLALTVEPPDEAGRLAILRSQFAHALAATRAPLDTELDGATLAVLNDATPRQLRLVFDLAIASSVSAQRTRLNCEDVRLGMRLIAGLSRQRKMGF